ncbi:MAG: pseudouridine-5'-phosphate glycosidase [Propionibacteriaceae bacterium]|nr:pseudouridine-5'-phosphate glycosidase [Propionibacteriaceae bacterium]
MTIKVGAHVVDALRAGQPVLALESTIITHGLPRPRNLDVALEAEQQVRDAGVVPATVGVVDGNPTIGLNQDELTRLAQDDNVVKLSIRDLPVATSLGLSGGTTVAATAMLASLAGIEVFATGGLGGVHRGASQTFDESADLPALAQYPIVVVSAGVKSLLDISATLERLETLSIPVVGYRTKAYPGFYVSDSGYKVDYAVDTPQQIADMADARDAMGLHCAILVANPVDEAHQLDKQLHDKTLVDALAAADAQGVHGHDITPFLLDYMLRHTNGESLEANLAIYRSNVALGAQIAAAIATLQSVVAQAQGQGGGGCGCGGNGGGCGGNGGGCGC